MAYAVRARARHSLWIKQQKKPDPRFRGDPAFSISSFSSDAQAADALRNSGQIIGSGS